MLFNIGPGPLATLLPSILQVMSLANTPSIVLIVGILLVYCHATLVSHLGCPVIVGGVCWLLPTNYLVCPLLCSTELQPTLTGIAGCGLCPHLDMSNVDTGPSFQVPSLHIFALWKKSCGKILTHTVVWLWVVLG